MKNIFLITVVAAAILISCNKESVAKSDSQLSKQSAQLIIDWNNIHFRVIKSTTSVGHIAYARHFAYTGIALYESLVNGDPRKRSILSSLNGTIVLPTVQNGNHLFFPAAANAAMANMLRYFYTSKASNIGVIDSLEQAYKTKYDAEAKNNFDINASVQYGKAIAAAIIDWSSQDGASAASIPYTPLGEGYWEPTPPAFGQPAVPGWGNNRTILPGSTNNTLPAAPPAFSAVEGTPFYAMAKEVYDVSKNLTQDQKDIANFWDDAPNGKYISAFGHWFHILNGVLKKERTPLMKGAEAYLQLGITMHDAGISCWKAKYTYHQMRPVTYIRKHMGYDQWNPLIATPAHPEYSAAHATLSGSAAYALESAFGQNYSFVDDTYIDLGMPSRTYPSFEAAGIDAGLSRLYGGIHYRPSIEAGNAQGKKTGENVHAILRIFNY
ncbi:vanadium-dependent haloperoxidase [Flavihumibacter fluvii]|uniref:vanadium-dependent haloperoxidase n=1 Tax=Flavihumibacter fluvii TaxID=2838157 RepID=UPI001BDDD6DF|nr:vanadium-dependent haloperoxidase [Flavihumibacter fluvii]ULQ53215.1 vanadium-dependent haloperoxidase [Flavihumibacter fluvii]